MPLSSSPSDGLAGKEGSAKRAHREPRGAAGPWAPLGPLSRRALPPAPCSPPGSVWAEFSLGGSGLVTLHLVTGVFLEDSWGGAWRSPKCGLWPREGLRAWWASPREPTRLCPLTRLPALSERDGGPFFAVLWSGREAGDEAEDSEVL